jgi:predicted RNase H-like nuclease (RuvC/YqgF family)
MIHKKETMISKNYTNIISDYKSRQKETTNQLEDYNQLKENVEKLQREYDEMDEKIRDYSSKYESIKTGASDSTNLNKLKCVIQNLGQEILGLEIKNSILNHAVLKEKQFLQNYVKSSSTGGEELDQSLFDDVI